MTTHVIRYQDLVAQLRLPEGWAQLKAGRDADSTMSKAPFEAADVVESLARTLDANTHLDCRTCRHLYDLKKGCLQTGCTDGSHYIRNGTLRLWKSDKLPPLDAARMPQLAVSADLDGKG